MPISGFSDLLLAWIRDHAAWAPIVVWALAFCESLAFISLLVPATVILIGAGGLIGAAGLSFWVNWLAAAVGAALGDWLSFWLARRYDYAITGLWPLSRHPGLLQRGEAFFRRWGVLGVFFGRFFGPLRATVPLAAGIAGMKPLPFQLANVTSALLWAAGILAPGAFGIQWLM
ncbi:putative membrane protein [Rhodovastum atsumiense]|uniref:DedA family protein n=1 Tax=Rhodovastum atsumiense TaxID=504468 RepID=A0A5M6IRM4_9PROT|nr:DedA family protein [Rhodovastum atsumiense]CAH2601516.1 putative membrane protein [Rhodovastum atsumiense]